MALPLPAARQAEALEPEALLAALLAREPAAADAPDRVRIVRAPGRVNLIGEHTDYNDGLVLPAAIDREVRIAFVPTDDGIVRLTSLDEGETEEFDLAAIGPARGRWIDYVAGTAWAMAAAGLSTAGFRGVVASDLPPRSGLSSSAAIEVATVRILRRVEIDVIVVLVLDADTPAREPARGLFLRHLDQQRRRQRPAEAP